MPTDRRVIEEIVIEALTPASRVGSVTRDTEILHLVDSLGLVTALASIQAALHLSLEPEQLIDIFACRSISDLAITLEGALSNQVHG
jgi:hypothetical protein